MNGMKMLIFIIITCFALDLAEGQANAEFKYVESCYKFGQTLTLEAVYNGSGTPVTVQWSYSEGTGTNLFVLTSTCVLFGSVPPGYPDGARMEYTCSTTDATLPANTYRLTVEGLTSDESTDSWGATFAPPSGTAPAADQKAIPICATTVGNTGGLSTGAKAGIGCAVVAVVGIGIGATIAVVKLKKMGKLPGKSDKDDTSRDVESTSSSPKNANSNLLNEKKQNSASGKADGMNKGKHVSDTQIHLDKSPKVHPGNEEKPHRPQPLPPPVANINHSLAEDNHGTGAGDSFSLTKLPPIQHTPRTDKPN